MAISVSKIRDYMKNDLNIIISGEAGTGKTAILQEAASDLNLKMKYYSAATLDPYTDLVGIPVPQNETKTVEYYRPRDLDEAEIVFFDELNRADRKTLNTVFELIQFRSINGEKLPKLRSVVAAINPAGGSYTVDELDTALLDRFDIYLQSTPTIDRAYFKKLFGAPLASAATTFWESYERDRTRGARSKSNSMTYISPRRLEKIVSNFVKIPNRLTLTESLPPGVNTSVNELYKSFSAALDGDNEQASKKVTKGANFRETYDSLMSNAVEITLAKNYTKVKEVFFSPEITDKEKSALVTAVSNGLNYGAGPETIMKKWSFILSAQKPSDSSLMRSGWPYTKNDALNSLMRLAAIDIV